MVGVYDAKSKVLSIPVSGKQSVLGVYVYDAKPKVLNIPVSGKQFVLGSVSMTPSSRFSAYRSLANSLCWG